MRRLSTSRMWKHVDKVKQTWDERCKELKASIRDQLSTAPFEGTCKTIYLDAPLSHTDCQRMIRELGIEAKVDLTMDKYGVCEDVEKGYRQFIRVQFSTMDQDVCGCVHM
jgi:hypothetical protein